ncbi:MAG: LamG domain-containing protein, partial [Planctomycetes bacterium]|nr:LamG domain-containing protein [Planctomycetota bacterium]
RGGCPSGDRMPDAPSFILEPLVLDPSGSPASGPFGYPIPWSALWPGYAPVGSPFHNLLQFRGQTLDIWDADRPNTDPTTRDTGGHGLSDGWLYYFYANAVNNTNFVGEALDPTTLNSGLVISNDVIRYSFNPAYDRGLAGDDLDQDGLTTLEEYYLGTNPIHWDTDGDGMPDGWEVQYGLDALNRTDAAQNPDQDFMADDGEGLIHGDVYDEHGLDPRTAWTERVFRPNLTFSPPAAYEPPLRTRPFTNLDEFLAMRWRIDRGTIPGNAIPPADWATYSTDPLSPDTDLDRMPDGWELYVGLEPANPQDNTDGPLNADGPADALTNMQEFRCRGAEAFYDATRLATIVATAESRRQGSIHVFTPAYRPDGWRESFLRDAVAIPADHFAMHDHADWLNKFWPTDPNNPDTDRDQISDSAEYAAFRYTVEGVSGVLSGRGYVGGGLNPTSADTDADWLPDYWEVRYAGETPATDGVRNGMDGTFIDHQADYDNDGLANYQEYLVNAVWHFQYDKWTAGRGYGLWDPDTGTGGYDPIQFFYPAHEFGAGNFGEAPHFWDLGYWFNPRAGIRFFYQLAEARPLLPGNYPKFASTDPRNWDSDGDGMDDFYEMYHALNPLWGDGLFPDLVAKGPPPLDRDARTQPWQVGDAAADPDQDDIPNWEEALHPNRTQPQPHHTDPTPYWFTDLSYSNSFVNLYYQPKTLAHPVSNMFYWVSEPRFQPAYMFSFEANEGSDTDNDGVPDKRELLGGDEPGTTDPLDFNDPDRRVALYLDGDSAARTQTGFFHGSEVLRTWTVELWMRPEVLASSARQILIERPATFSSGDPMPVPENVRRNFRLGIDEDGYLFVEYYNDGSNLDTRRARADYPLPAAGRWYHVAGVFTGTQLQLYLDGKLFGGIPSTAIPANGAFYANPDVFFPPPLVVGAADDAPSAFVHGSERYLNGVTVAAPDQPELHSFFKGHVDEIRVWDGVRSVAELNDAMQTRLRRTDVLAFQEARRTDPAQALILYHYNFATLRDPVFEPLLPAGFEARNGRPNDGSYPGIPWWRLAQDRSTVYDNAIYVPWIENTVAH